MYQQLLNICKGTVCRIEVFRASLEKSEQNIFAPTQIAFYTYGSSCYVNCI